MNPKKFLVLFLASFAKAQEITTEVSDTSTLSSTDTTPEIYFESSTVILTNKSQTDDVTTEDEEEDDDPMELDILEMSDYYDLPVEIQNNVTLLQSIVNATHHRGILHGFSESISVILVSEIGDKTFFIAAILAMRNNKLIVFLAALSALFLMTILSALLGWVVTTFIPR